MRDGIDNMAAAWTSNGAFDDHDFNNDGDAHTDDYHDANAGAKTGIWG